MTASTPQHDRPLEGLRVLDFTQNLPGPYTTMILGSMGAEVIKIEPPRGDVARSFARMFEIVNAGKKSITLDLKDVASRPALDRLVASADVLVEGFRPGVMARLGAGPAEATAANERLVYCSISGFGQDGPYRDYPGHDLNYQALTGVCHMMRDSHGHPLGAAIPIGDLSASMTAVSGILAALYARERTGRGRILDVAMVDALLSWAFVWAEGLTPTDARFSGAARPAAAALRGAAKSMGGPLGGILERAATSLRGEDAKAFIDRWGERFKSTKRWDSIRRLRLHALPHYAIYKTRDGQWLSVGIVDEDKFWRELCDVLGLGPLAKIPLLGRFVAGGPLRKAVGAAIARRDLDHWLAVVDRERLPIAPVLTVDEALHDPQLLGRRLGADRHVHAPWPLSGPVEGKAPRLGEHNDEILAD